MTREQLEHRVADAIVESHTPEELKEAFYHLCVLEMENSDIPQLLEDAVRMGVLSEEEAEKLDNDLDFF